jgi:hypothetical protein
VKKWFKARMKPGIEPELWKEFLSKLRNYPAISKLSENPLLLTYLCLIFKDNYDFPKNESGIFREVVDLFLRKWDASRGIARIPVANKLDSARKFLLFREIAYQGMTQETPQFIWKENDLRSQIRRFMDKLSIVKEEEVDQDTELVLKVVIRDHGLLVPASRHLYQFPYRSFQYFFAAKDVCGKINNNFSFLQEIISRYLTDREWKNVFLMVAELTEDSEGSDKMFRLIFEYVNNLVAENETIQKMLIWLHKITQDFGVDSSSWRALMIAIDLDTDLYISHDIKIEKFDAQQTPVVMKSFNKDRNKIIPNNSKLISSLYLIVAHTFAIDRADGKDPTLKNSTDSMKKILVVDENTTTEQQIALAINEAKEIGDIDPNFLDNLMSLQTELPSEDDTQEIWMSWSERLRKLLLTHLDLGHRVKFSKEDEKVLEDYLYANNLLVKCLAGDSLSTRSLRENIFDHILLPTDSIPDDLKLNSHS